MRVDEAKEAVLISFFTQAKETSFRRPYEVVLLFGGRCRRWPFGQGNNSFIIVAL
jgi:hypothetical protein